MSNKLGPTGKYPEGKLNDNDDGELRIAIGTESDKVKILFETDVSWFAMNPDEAIQLGEAIIKQALKIKGADCIAEVILDDKEWFVDGLTESQKKAFQDLFKEDQINGNTYIKN